MMDFLSYSLDYLSHHNPMAAKKVKRNLKLSDERHAEFANVFFGKYSACLLARGKSFDYALDCYLKLIADMIEMRMQFLETNQYANVSFEDVNNRIYGNPDVMDYHMHGLAVAQFLWHDQYKRYIFFRDNIQSFGEVNSYLEIGGGHALYADAALDTLNKIDRAILIDISESSLKLARCILKGRRVHFIFDDVFNMSLDNQFDFITIGEVIEHLEDPAAMLKQLKNMLKANGTIFISTPVNAPMIDHIFLFRHEDEIRNLIRQAGFEITKELVVISEEIPTEKARELKVPIMYAAFITHA